MAGATVVTWPTTTLVAEIDRDISFVVGWFKSPARLQEVRAHWEALDVADFSWLETVDAEGVIIQIDASWTRRNGVAINVQRRFEEAGSRSTRGTTWRQSRYPNGRVETAVTKSATHFTEPRPGRTRVESTVEYTTEGQRMRAKLPGMRKLLMNHLDREFKDVVARCATA